MCTLRPLSQFHRWKSKPWRACARHYTPEPKSLGKVSSQPNESSMHGRRSRDPLPLYAHRSSVSSLKSLLRSSRVGGSEEAGVRPLNLVTISLIARCDRLDIDKSLSECMALTSAGGADFQTRDRRCMYPMGESAVAAQGMMVRMLNLVLFDSRSKISFGWCGHSTQSKTAVPT